MWPVDARILAEPITESREGRGRMEAKKDESALRQNMLEEIRDAFVRVEIEESLLREKNDVEWRQFRKVRGQLLTLSEFQRIFS
jgi:hypothetical protein